MHEGTCLKDLAADLQGSSRGNYNETDLHLCSEAQFLDFLSSAIASLFY
jgi:hypothetical protein